MHTILLVEDIPQEREAYATLLKAALGETIHVLEAATLSDALTLIKAHRNSIVAIILDLDIPEDPSQPRHDKPSPVGLELFRDEAWFCPVIIFSAHQDKNLITPEKAKLCHPWHMISKGAPDCEKHLVEHVQRAIEIQEVSMQVMAQPGAPSPLPAVPVRVGTLAAAHFQPAALGSVEAMLRGRDWSMDAYQEGLIFLQAAVSQQGGAIIQILGTTAACVFPAVGEEPHHFAKAVRALRIAFNDIRHSWNGRVRARFSAGLFVGQLDVGVGLGAVYAALPAELAHQMALQVAVGEVAVPQAHLAANGFEGQWKGFFSGNVKPLAIQLAGGGAVIPVSVGLLA